MRRRISEISQKKLKYFWKKLEIARSELLMQLEQNRTRSIREVVAYFHEAFVFYNDKLLLFKEIFKTELYESLLFELKEYNYRKLVYEISKRSAACVEIANDFVRLFEHLILEYRFNREALEQNEIIKGIAETIDIKLESINEGISILTDESKKLIADLISYKNLTDEEFSVIYEDCFRLFVQKMSEEINQDKDLIELINESFAESLLQSPYQNCYNRNKRFFSTASQSYKKFFLKFYKESLFAEITTFEELMNYSVSYLRNADDQAVLRFVQAMDEAFLELEDICKRNDFILIRPEPHSPFDSKEHEILTAESNPDFAKGQVIKLVNTGFKNEETVILRANIIAAR